MGKRKHAPMGLAFNPHTGKISETVSISTETVDALNKALREMGKIIKGCAEYEHHPALDKRIEAFLSKHKVPK